MRIRICAFPVAVNFYCPAVHVCLMVRLFVMGELKRRGVLWVVVFCSRRFCYEMYYFLEYPCSFFFLL